MSRPATSTRQRLVDALVQQKVSGDYIALGQRIGAEPSRIHQMVRDLARAGVIESCAKVPTGSRPRNVYRAADPARQSAESAHQFLARTLFDAWY
jgi:predicted ArsR family transcriptional regulator